MPAFVGFFIAVVIVLCLLILLFVGRGILGLTRRYRDARRRRSVTSGSDREGASTSAEGTTVAETPGPDETTPAPVDDEGGAGDGRVYICPQLHATWQERGNCPECDQRGVPMGG